MLDGLRDKIGNLKRVTIDIGEEARSQNKLLNDMGRDMDSSHGLLGATMKKLGIVSRARGKFFLFHIDFVISLFQEVMSCVIWYYFAFSFSCASTT